MTAMDAERQLLAASREWRRLAEAEGEAIRTANWTLLSACQKALESLRRRITALMPAVREEWSKPGGDRTGKQHSLDDTFRELLQMGRRNQTLLAVAREAARQKLQQHGEARLRLRQLRRLYGPSTGNAWSSFS